MRHQIASNDDVVELKMNNNLAQLQFSYFSICSHNMIEHVCEEIVGGIAITDIELWISKMIYK